MKKAFTLIELLISIAILSILMLFLYKSYWGLNQYNTIFAHHVDKKERLELIKKTLYLDFITAQNKSITILHQNKKVDIAFLQSNNSLHQRVVPYIAYIVREHQLYRLESLKPFHDFPLNSEDQFVADYLGKITIFRVYQSKSKEKHSVLVHILFQNKDEILLKIPLLNELSEEN